MTKRRTVLKGSTVLMLALASGCASPPGATNPASNAAQISGAGLISNNAGGLVSNNAGGLISNNAGGLISNNAGGLISNNAGGLISNNAGGLISNNAGGLISNNAGGLISNNAGGLISNNAGGLTGTVRGPAAGLISNNAGGLISNNAGGLISNNAGGLISNNAGGLISNNAGGLISNNAGGFRTLSVDDDGDDTGLTTPVPGAKVACFNEHGEQVSYAWTTTDENGSYTFTRLKASGPVIFVKAVYEREGKQVVLISTAPAPRKPGTINVTVSPATSIVAKKLGEMIRLRAVSVASVRPSSVDKIAQQIAPALSPKAVVAAAIGSPSDVAGEFDNILKESPTLAAVVKNTGSSEGIGNLVAVTPPESNAAPVAGGSVGAPPPENAPPASGGSTGNSGGNTAAPSSSGGNTTDNSNVVSNPGNSGGSNGGAPPASSGPTASPSSAPTTSPSGSSSPSASPSASSSPKGGSSNLVATVGTLGTVAFFGHLDMPFGGNSFAVGEFSAATSGTINSPTDKLTFTNDTGKAAKSVTFDGSTAYYLVDNTIIGNGATVKLKNVAASDTTDLAVKGGFAYVSSAASNVIYKVDLSSGDTSVFAGVPTNIGGFADGDGANAHFNSPQGMCFSGSTLYVADAYNYRIRAIGPDGSVSTLAGGTYGSADGLAGLASFRSPVDVTADDKGNLFVADQNGHNIRKIQVSDGKVTTVAGTGLGGNTDGQGSDALLSFPSSLAWGKVGGQEMLVVSQVNRHIRIITGW